MERALVRTVLGPDVNQLLSDILNTYAYRSTGRGGVIDVEPLRHWPSILGRPCFTWGPAAAFAFHPIVSSCALWLPPIILRLTTPHWILLNVWDVRTAVLRAPQKCDALSPCMPVMMQYLTSSTRRKYGFTTFMSSIVSVFGCFSHLNSNGTIQLQLPLSLQHWAPNFISYQRVVRTHSVTTLWWTCGPTWRSSCGTSAKNVSSSSRPPSRSQAWLSSKKKTLVDQGSGHEEKAATQHTSHKTRDAESHKTSFEQLPPISHSLLETLPLSSSIFFMCVDQQENCNNSSTALLALIPTGCLILVQQRF